MEDFCEEQQPSEQKEEIRSSEEKKSAVPVYKKLAGLLLALLYMVSFVTFLPANLFGLGSDEHFDGMMGGTVTYGPWPLAFCSGFASLVLYSIAYQIFYLIRNRRKVFVYLLTGFIIGMVVAGWKKGEALSRDQRANKDIEPYVLEHLIAEYGRDAVADMKIVLERWSFDWGYDDYTYTVTGPTLDDPREIIYTVRQSYDGGTEPIYTRSITEQRKGKIPLYLMSGPLSIKVTNEATGTEHLFRGQELDELENVLAGVTGAAKKIRPDTSEPLYSLVFGYTNNAYEEVTIYSKTIWKQDGRYYIVDYADKVMEFLEENCK